MIRLKKTNLKVIPASVRWSRSESDFLGRTVVQSRPGFGGSTLVTSNYYDTAGNLVSTLSLSTRSTYSTRLNSQLYFYNELNERIATIDDRNFNEIIDWTGSDLISSNLTHYVKLNGDWWRETRQWSIHDDNSAEARLMNVSRSRITGLGANGLASESISIDQRGNATTNRLFRNRVAAEDIAWVKYPTSTIPAVTVSTNGLMMSSTSQTGVTTTFAYDAFQREVSQTDGRGNTTRTVYDSLGRVSSTIDALGYATAYGYDALGRQISVTDPLTNTVYTAYDSEGRVVAQRGATYPVDYSYDEFGDKISMTTYRDINAAGDVTRWLRDEATGLVTNKVYADGKGPKYTYTPDGKLATRTWARGIVTTYSYDANGALTNTVYSDSTPSISLVYNRAGRQIRAEDAAGVTMFAYDEFGPVNNETVVGVAGTNTIERFYDNYGRLQYNSDLLLHYGENGLLESVSNSVANAKYRYTVDNIDEGYHIALSNGIVLDRTLARDYARGSVITNITSAVDGVIIENLVYKYDVLKRPISRNADEFSYNDRNEVVSAIIENISKMYGYDEIGNSSFFQANNLNQYSEYEYDSDGNLLSCGELTFGYDGENRLTTVLSNGVLLVTNVYDTKSRRVKKVTSEATMTFFYDDWNLIEERIAYTNGTTTTIQYYWGKDLSGELQGAGGVSGLLYLTVSNSNSQLQLYIPCYDNNGNVTKYVDANGNIVASYTYDAFGNLISKSGTLADFFRHRFSTKYFDVKTELYYYGYRFYHPVLMRWLNRDPIEEYDGNNLYLFCSNSSMNVVDKDGRWRWTEATAVSELQEKIREMRKNGYNFAADALEHYIGQHPSNIDLSRYASQIYNDRGWQQSFMDSVIAELKKKDPKGTNKKVEIGDIEHKKSFSEDMQTVRIDNMFRQIFSHRFQPYHDMGLFYALYGSHYSYIGTASWCRKTDRNFLSMSFHADVETDLEVVSWDPLSYGGSGMRDIAPSYSAARYLQDVHGYRNNFIYLKWKEKGCWRRTTYSSARGNLTYTHRISTK